WTEAAEAIETALEATIAAGTVTYDFARLMEGATEVRTSEFATAIIARLQSAPPAPH
nr:isocitrate/isopropylmalate family dehydrogenase [Acidimicrobiia bacterium]